MKKFVSPLLNKPFKPPVKTTEPKEEVKKETPKENVQAKEEKKDQDVKPTEKVAKKPFKAPSVIKTSSETPKTTSDKKTTENETKSKEVEPETQYWTVLYTKRSTKKHKKYDDGIIVIKPDRYMLLDTTGKTIYQRADSKTIQNFKEGNGFELGTYEMEFTKKIPSNDYVSGKCFFQAVESSTPQPKKKTEPKKFVAHTNSTAEIIREFKPDPTPKDAFVLNEGHPTKDKDGSPCYDVYIDPRLSKILRDYQKEGVKFMYECVMGTRDYKGNGCLLADDMGLGKSIQTVALIWTLLQRGPKGPAAIKKVIVVTNSSIVKNWKNEFKRWLGDDRLKPLVVSAKTTKQKPSDVINIWKNSKHPVLIISYDLCIRNSELLQECKCDLLVCDEGHKLKNKNIKIFGVLRGLTSRKVILSGTPLQNDLSEFFCIVDFINPGLLVNGDEKSFNNLFTNPISKSREPNASKEEKEMGTERSKALNQLTNLFILRRTREKLTNLLPPRFEMIVFCTLSELQKNLYTHIIKSKYMKKILQSDERSFNNTLSIIQSMKKLLTHPNMVLDNIKDSEEFEDQEMDLLWKDAIEYFPKDYKKIDASPKFSNKMFFLLNLLIECKKIGDKIVIISNFTSILDTIQMMCIRNDFSWTRVDGQTQTSKRQDIIDKFNDPKSDTFVFLLSAKAGGYGINLIGANRLVLFDPDWNPSVDIQAMSRVYREGQKKNVFIYRLISRGTIEEKIFQRQIVKTSLSKTVVDEKKSKSNFSKEMLKELFIYKEEGCETFQSEENNDFISEVKKCDSVLHKILKNEETKDLVSFIKLYQDEKGNIEKLEDVEDEEKGEEKESESEEEEYTFDEEDSKKEEIKEDDEDSNPDLFLKKRGLEVDEEKEETKEKKKKKK